ncbi:ABC transporter permease [Agrococcus jejuensis]|uniref:ABC-2 type transport system permease protein n=1 Tax=Agrococcus jejuensis TaxID=399736 RepID=A0A1G8AZP7_9MICO|nr:ABC transporter permease [Agrococcus jejuensis]SDH26418.1 ABC-2 type transport system permease protein [Agrococcus jejuensis]
MSTAAATTDAPDVRRATYRETPHHVSFGGVLRSEWIKLTSVRSIGWAIAIAVVITAGLGALATLATLATAPEDMPLEALFAQVPIASLGSSGLLVSQLVFAIIGVIAITGEYGSGQIRSSFTAVPSRLPVLGAKALVLGLIAFVASGLALAVGMASTIGVAASFGVAIDDMGIDASVGYAVLGGAVYLALLTVFSLAVGALVRSGAGGIAIALGVLLVLPVVMGLIPFEWVQDASPYLLSNGGMQLSLPGLEPTSDFWRGLAVTAAWPAVALVGAAAALVRRDA